MWVTAFFILLFVITFTTGPESFANQGLCRNGSLKVEQFEFNRNLYSKEREYLANQGINIIGVMNQGEYILGYDSSLSIDSILNRIQTRNLQIRKVSTHQKLRNRINSRRVWVLVNQKKSIEAWQLQFNSCLTELRLIKKVTPQVLEIEIDPAFIHRLANLSFVLFIENKVAMDVDQNVVAAQRLKIDQVQVPPLSLKGRDIKVGIWEIGGVESHKDFADRLTIVDPVITTNHATHVAGTIGSNGEADARALGMAPKAQLYAYDYKNDSIEIKEAAENGLHLSNHSYGSIVGWNWSSDGTWKKYSEEGFGKYSLVAREWDDIVYKTDLVMFKSAGNDRNDGPGNCPGGDNCDGPYDSIPHKGIAKNVITIGSLNDWDQMTNYSGFGPSDDGRVKPDLCANGQGVYSSITNNAYAKKSGTSIASAVAAGGTALLMQYYIEQMETPPSASMVKSLLIHGAKQLPEYGPGPSYATGYGLINIKKSIQLIKIRAFKTGQIEENQSVIFDVDVIANKPQLKVTLVWTDPPGYPTATQALVNDLNLKLISPNNRVYHPYGLNPANPTQKAKRQVNNRDNVEQVVIAKPIKGHWQIKVTGPSIPLGPQSFTLVSEFLD